MKKALILFALSIVLVPATIAQSMDVGVRHFQNQLQCGPNPARERVFIHKYSPNNNHDFVGYMELNVHNCTSHLFEPGNGRSDDRVLKPKRRRY